MDFIIQGIGIVGAILSFIAFQNKHHFKILMFKMGSTLCFALQFALLKAYTGMAMNIFEVVVLLTDAILVSKNKKTISFIIVSGALCVVIGAFTWIGYVSILAIAGGLIVTIAFGIKNPKYLRFVFFFGSICWLIYDIIYFSLGGIITEVFSLVSIIIATIAMFCKKNICQAEDFVEETPKEE